MYGSEDMYLSAKRKPRKWTKLQLESRYKRMIEKMEEWEKKNG